MIGVNLALTAGDPAPVFLAAHAAATALCTYGAFRAAPGRRPALALAGVALAVLGLLAVLSTGLPLIVAGGLALVAASRSAAVPA